MGGKVRVRAQAVGSHSPRRFSTVTWDDLVIALAQDVREVLEDLHAARREAELALAELHEVPRRRRQEKRERYVQRLLAEAPDLDPEADEHRRRMQEAIEATSAPAPRPFDDGLPAPALSTRDIHEPASPEEVSTAAVHQALEHAYRLLATVKQDGSPQAGIEETLRLGLVGNIEEHQARRRAAEERRRTERELWAIFLTRRLTTEERMVISLRHRSGHAVAVVASALRLTERQVRTRLQSAHAKVRAFIFGSDGE